jgi:hypothetical protein
MEAPTGHRVSSQSWVLKSGQLLSQRKRFLKNCHKKNGERLETHSFISGIYQKILSRTINYENISADYPWRWDHTYVNAPGASRVRWAVTTPPSMSRARTRLRGPPPTHHRRGHGLVCPLTLEMAPYKSQRSIQQSSSSKTADKVAAFSSQPVP